MFRRQWRNVRTARMPDPDISHRGTMPTTQTLIFAVLVSTGRFDLRTSGTAGGRRGFPMPEIRTGLMAALLLILALPLCPGIARGQDGPTPPCGSPPVPAALPDQPPAVQAWSDGA